MSPPRRTRHVASHGLRSIDASTIRLFLNFASQQTRDSWQLGELPAAELVFVPAGEPVPTEAVAAIGVWVGPVPEHVRTMPAEFEPVKRLAQPLQLEAFIEVLRQVERADPPAAPVAGKTAPPHPAALPATAASAPMAKPAAPTVPPPRQARDPRARFRLKRWPSARSLARHRYLPRLASFLSARHLSVLELAALSNVSAQECQAFLDDMAAQGILEQRIGSPGLVLPPAPPPATHASTLPPSTLPPSDFGADTVPERPPQAAPRETALGGLMQRLRSRLGLS
ncbi:hypothetical protein LRH25_27280 [Ideonella azotifigens]|uniref:DUF4388 domain-containing protein n=2 Tax=Ideonella azotifigens TaxID=513160 RepID=A0ABN1KBS9_9BURK|nr:hypothetical protein [Ideonella azotifigens]MCD2344031.1 hypothetical protein [Ideonella azotifigens]